MIEIKGVSKTYGDVVALDNVTIDIGPREIVGLLGPNGAGKTTLLRILTGFFEPSAGEVRVGGIDVVADPTAAQALVGYLPESTPLYPEMLVQEYLQMVAPDLRGLPQGSKRLDLLAEAVWATGIEDKLTSPIGALSRGYRQRVGIAQAILHKPRVVILDEPTSGLDPSQVVLVRDLMKRLAQNATVLFSTHILTEVEQVCERALILLGGRVQTDARLADLQRSSELVVAVAGDAATTDEVVAPVRDLSGVTRVEVTPGRAGYVTLRVSASESATAELGRAVFRLAQRQGWELGELRPVTRTLESVFADLVRGSGAARTAGVTTRVAGATRGAAEDQR